MCRWSSYCLCRRGCELDGPGSEFRQGQEVFLSSPERASQIGMTKTLFSKGLMRPEHDVHHCPSCSVEVKDELSYIYSPAIRFLGKGQLNFVLNCGTS